MKYTLFILAAALALGSFAINDAYATHANAASTTGGTFTIGTGLTVNAGGATVTAGALTITDSDGTNTITSEDANNDVDVLRINHHSTGNGATGDSTALTFGGTDDAGNDIEIGSLDFEFTDADTGSSDAELNIFLVENDTIREVLVLSSTGTLNVDGTVQEAGVDISPIGTQQISFAAQLFENDGTDVLAALASTELGTNSATILEASFADSGGPDAFWITWATPSNWDAGTINAKIYWHATTNINNVEFHLGAISLGDDDIQAVAAGVNVDLLDTAGDTNDDLMITALSGAITPSSTGVVAAGDLILLEIERDGQDNEDTVATAVEVVAVVIQYTTNAATVT